MTATSVVIADLSHGDDARGDWVYFIEGKHFSDDEWSVDDQARTNSSDPEFFRVLHNGVQEHGHGWIKDNRIIQWG